MVTLEIFCDKWNSIFKKCDKLYESQFVINILILKRVWTKNDLNNWHVGKIGKIDSNLGEDQENYCEKWK